MHIEDGKPRINALNFECTETCIHATVLHKPTRSYGDVFEYDNTPLVPGEQRAVLCNGESTWQPTAVAA